MMITGTVDDAAGAVYAKPTVGVMDLAARSTAEYVRTLPTRLASRVTPMIREYHDRFVNTSVSAVASAIRNKVESYFSADAIQLTQTPRDMQTANLAMRNVLMVSPTARRLKKAGTISGYGDDYEDTTPHLEGSLRPDYRRVYCGVFRRTEETVKHEHYYERLSSGEVAMSMYEQAMAVASIDALEDILEDGGVDPTSEWNEFMG